MKKFLKILFGIDDKDVAPTYSIVTWEENANNPANPIEVKLPGYHKLYMGISKRELFAIEITKSMCKNPDEVYKANGGFTCPEPLCADAVRIADELLRQLSK